MQKHRFRVMNSLLLAAILMSAPVMADDAQDSAPKVVKGDQQATKAELDQYYRAHWRAIDPTQQGEVSRDEFIRNGFNLDRVPEDQRAVNRQFLNNLFKEMDGDANKKLTQAEFLGYHQKRFDEIDTNKNQILSIDEVKAFEKKAVESSKPAQ